MPERLKGFFFNVICLAVCIPSFALGRDAGQIRRWVEQVGSKDRAEAWQAEKALAEAGESAVEAILNVMENEGMPHGHRKNLGIVLGKIGSPKANDRLIRLYGATGDFYVREGICHALRGQDTPETKAFFEERLKEEDETFRALGIRGLAATRDPQFLGKAVESLRDESGFVREYAIRAIGKYETIPDELLPLLLDHLAKESDEELRMELVGIFLESAPQEDVKEALKRYRENETSLRIKEMIAGRTEPKPKPPKVSIPPSTDHGMASPKRVEERSSVRHSVPTAPEARPSTWPWIGLAAGLVAVGGIVFWTRRRRC